MCSFMFHVYICRTCMYVSLIYIYDGEWKMEDCKNCKLYHRTVSCKVKLNDCSFAVVHVHGVFRVMF